MIWAIFALFLGMFGVAIMFTPGAFIPVNRFAKIGIGVFLIILAIVVIANDYSWAIMMR